MADLTITAANVAVEASSAIIRSVQAGETLVEGEVIYRKNSDGKYYKADNNVDEETALARGIVINGAATDAYALIVTGGYLDIGATLVVGTPYVLSATAGGKIAPAADLATGNYITHLGYAVATDSLDVSIRAHGVTK